MKEKKLKWHILFFFAPYDIWIGVFIKNQPKYLGKWNIYICLLPCCVLQIYQVEEK